ncbi:hypothetical protein G7054_g2951 [Neopestalotiopsis clavispora]|nr:hypothetical protein G7054_g2951 [Neopestalotiopsis clavispora]
MTLCDDCRNIRLAEHLKGMQKLDKHVLRKQNTRFRQGGRSGLLKLPSDVAKSAFAFFGWRWWSTYAQEFIKSSVKDLSRTQTYYEGYEWERGTILANLGLRLRQLPLEDCAFCTILRNVRIPPHIDASSSDADLLVAFRYYEDVPKMRRWDSGGTPSDVVVVGVVAEYHPLTFDPPTFDIRNYEELMLKTEPRGFLTCRLKDREDDVSLSIRAQQPTFNFGEISQVIQDCQQSHPECRIRRTASSTPIKISLIDCYSREMIQATSSEAYVALSYVWGGVSAGTLKSTILPRTLEDAMQVTQALGLRYIWIDQFCVDQYNHEIKHEQIRTMGRVYEDAIVTLVAASGSDANAGLPGAPCHPKKFRTPTIINGCIISEEEVPINTGIQNSVWAGRGWTFQELFFSQRLLVFSSEQACFECRRVKYSPRFGFYDTGLRKSSRDFRTWDTLHSRLYEDNSPFSESVKEEYELLVTRYWHRQLSLMEDGINAFAAILNYLESRWNAELNGPKMTFVAGIPHLLQHKERSSTQSTRLFVDGLGWYSKAAMKRRKGFPSWCWAGWTSLEPETHRLSWCSGAEMSGMSREQALLFEFVPSAQHGSSSVPEAVVLVAPIIHPSVVSWFERERQPQLWGTKTTWYLADKSLLHRDELMDKILTTEYCLIGLMYLELTFQNESDAVFLLVRRVDQYRHERIGLVYVQFDWFGQADIRKDMELRTWELI